MVMGPVEYQKRLVVSSGLESISFEHRQGRNLIDFFVSYIRSVASVTSRPDLDALWTVDGLTIPADYTTLALFSRRPFNYGVVVMSGRFSTLAADGQIEFIGFEHGGSFRTPYLLAYRASTKFWFTAQGAVARELELTSLLPADYDTADHYYQVKLNKCSGEFYIDDELKAIILFGIPEELPVWEDNPPYALRSFPYGIMGIGQSTCLEIARGAASAGAPHTFPILNDYQNRLVAADGDPLPPRQYAVYTENTATKWNGLATGGVVMTSHPIPIWGYPNKTLYFQADAAGTVDIQVYVGGGWGTVKSVLLVANTLNIQVMDSEAPIMRYVYTPTNADTITLAEVYLS